ncbi:response regulator [Luteibacter aegosomatis]|uniref:hybrid sensor histidine kinase/response regulator n=1 Tax=Luteibacter aegosomatis TaxID=2911537 RepID=UPI001FF9ED20|nr:response regulator [Luteibacter aegosomatis]UPG87655.1 response regulator [Luteibacter aegosomatis]
MRPAIYDDLDRLARAIGDEVGTVVITDEALAFDVSALRKALAAQPSWSDIPFVLLRAPRSRSGGRASALPAEVINVVEIERPLGSASLISAVESALRARFKQFVIRDQMISLERSQAALAASEAELRLVADALPVLIAFIDTGLVYRFANLAYEEWLGMPIADIIGRRVEDVVGPRLWNQRKGDIERVLRGEGILAEIGWPMPDGRRRDAEVRYIPRFDALGNVDGFHVFAADITDRKMALETTQQQAALLERRVAERTAELEAEMVARQASDEALRQAQKMEAVGQLTGGIAHDFNNMLTGILASLELMRTRADEGRVDGMHRLIDIATTAAQRAAGLTQRLLAFSRRQSLDPKPVDVGALVHSMDDLLTRTLGERVRLSLSVAPGLPPAMVDANQLESALLNLAINARDAMPDGGKLDVGITLERYADDDTDRYIVMTVADTGVGMDDATLAKVFEPFFTTKPIGQGTGLGMSMIYGFINQSRGHVRIRSAVGKGTTVCLYLPLAGETGNTEDGVRIARVTGGQGQQIVVVDDDPQVRVLVTELLKELGYDVLAADSAEAALPMLATGATPDLLVTDVGLPGLNGRQLADIVRRDRPELPVLFITGYAHNATNQAAFLDRGMKMISKPFSLATLSEAVGTMLHRP